MIAVDTNVLIYAHRSEMPQHVAASARVRELVESGQPWAIPWPCVHEFIGTVTNRRRIIRPSTPDEAFGAIEQWVRRPEVRLIGEGPHHLSTLRELVGHASAIGPRIHDARIAAICLSHGVSTLWTADRDFALFPQLKCENPLVP